MPIRILNEVYFRLCSHPRITHEYGRIPKVENKTNGGESEGIKAATVNESEKQFVIVIVGCF